MNKNNQTQINGQGLEFWENEVQILQNALDGIRTSHAVISQMLKNANDRVIELTPTKEEVLNG